MEIEFTTKKTNKPNVPVQKKIKTLDLINSSSCDI